jgi:sulfate adenylyltransferase subunit 1
LVEQTHRHYYIAALLRIRTVIVCVNKMDLVGYSQARFDEIARDFQRLAEQIGSEGQEIHILPVSSLHGENVTRSSTHLGWYRGPTLLDLLEGAEAHPQRMLPARLSVQHVIRPRTEALHDYRGYAGRVASGSFSLGDEVVVLPNERRSYIKAIERFGQRVTRAEAGESVTVQLADDIDVSRGCLLAKSDEVPPLRKEVDVKICWLDHQPLTAGKTYVLQHGVQRVRAKVVTIYGVVDVASLNVTQGPAQLKLNEIGTLSLKLGQPIFADDYADNPANGAFILIDEWTNNTSGIGFIEPDIQPESPPEVHLGFGV